MAEWNRLKKIKALVMASVELTRDGYLVAIRLEDDGMPGNILTVARGRTVDAAFNRAMEEAEQLPPQKLESEIAYQRKR